MEDNVIAKKSIKFAVLMFVATALLMAILVLFLYGFFHTKEWQYLIPSVILLVLVVFSLGSGVKTCLQPSVVIEDDGDALVINLRFGKTVRLRYCDIESVYSSPSRARGIEYSFGFIRISTKDKTYKVGAVGNVELAYKKIWEKIAYKYKY